MLTDVKIEALKCCSFDASPKSEWLITAHLERISVLRPLEVAAVLRLGGKG